MEIKKIKEIIEYIVIIITYIIFLGIIIYFVVNGFKKCSTPVEEKDDINKEVIKAKEDNKNHKDSINKLDKEYEKECNRIKNLNNDSTLIEFYRLIGK